MSYDAPPPPGEPTPESGATPPVPPPPSEPPAPPAPPADVPPPPPPAAGYPPPPARRWLPAAASWATPCLCSRGVLPCRRHVSDRVRLAQADQNFGALIVAVIIYVLILIVVEAIWYFLLRALFSGVDGWFGFLAVQGLNTLVSVVLYSVVQAGIARVSLKITDGHSFGMDDFFTTDELGNVIVTALIVGVGVAIGTFLCIIPGIIVAFLAQFAIFYVVDKRLAPVDAIKASFSLVSQNLGTLILFYVLTALVLIAGFCVICVGLFVAIPVVVIAQGYMFRRLQNDPVSA